MDLARQIGDVSDIEPGRLAFEALLLGVWRRKVGESEDKKMLECVLVI